MIVVFVFLLFLMYYCLCCCHSSDGASVVVAGRLFHSRASAVQCLERMSVHVRLLASGVCGIYGLLGIVLV